MSPQQLQPGADSGIAGYSAFWNSLKAQPIAITADDSIYNFISAAKLATGTDYTFLFKVAPVPTSGSPAINTDGVTSAANYMPTVAPGSISAIFGSFLLPSGTGTVVLPLPWNLSGVTAQFGNGTSAQFFYVSGGQINAQIPWELEGQTQTTLTVSVDGRISPAQTVSVAPFAPGVFTINAQGTGQGAILDTSYHLVDSSNAATAGSTSVLIFSTGLGAVTNQPPTGYPACAPSQPYLSYCPTVDTVSQTMATTTVTIGGVTVDAQFSGLAPGFVGLYQVNAQVPPGSATGPAVPVVISIGGVSSNTVTMAVQ